MQEDTLLSVMAIMETIFISIGVGVVITTVGFLLITLIPEQELTTTVNQLSTKYSLNPQVVKSLY